MTRSFTLGLVAVGLFGSPLAAEEANPKSQKKQAAPAREAASKLTGTYKIVAGERSGLSIAVERFDDVAVGITANVLTTYDKDEKAVYAATYEIDGSVQPWRITMVATVAPGNGKGVTSEGLIKIDGDTVTLIYSLPDGKAPTSFKTQDNQQLFILKKQIKAKSE